MGEHWEWCHVKYLSIPSGQSVVWGNKENAVRTAENISGYITHRSFLQGGKKSALHYLKVLGSRMEPNFVTGTNNFALPVAGQCFCSCILSLNILGLTWLSLKTWWFPIIPFCICDSWENEEQSCAERFPVLRRDLWRILMGGGVLWLGKCLSALLNGTNWIVQCLKIEKWVGIMSLDLCIFQHHDWNHMESDLSHQILRFCWCHMFLVVCRGELGMFSMQWSAYLGCASDFFGSCLCIAQLMWRLLWCQVRVPKDSFHVLLPVPGEISWPLPDLGF